jgi:glycosyltransferase involved in cell wall biosynthesis
VRVLFVAQDSKLFHTHQISDALQGLGAETEVMRFADYGYLSRRFTIIPKLKLLTHIVKFSPDVVFTDIYHWDAWASKIVAPILAHMRGDFWTEFNYLYALRSHKPLHSKMLTLLTKFIMVSGLGFAHTILPICDWLGGIVKTHYPRKQVRTLHQPIEPKIWTENYVEPMKLNHPAAISLFGFNIWPKVAGLVRFLPVAKMLSNTHFYIAGSGPYFERFLSYQPPSNMQFLGQLTYPIQVKSFLATGDVYIHPSGQDACPLTVMEAGLMEKAIVATNVGGVPEVIGDKKFLVKDGGTESWVSKIQYLLDHPEERERSGAVNRHHIEHQFSMDKITKELFTYMKDVLGGKEND